TFRDPGMGMFYISLDADNDPEFFRLVFPNFADDQITGLNRAQLLQLVNEVNTTNKAAKLTVRFLPLDGTWNVSAQVEAFVAGNDTLPDAALMRNVIGRYISAIRASRASFFKALDELKSSADGND